ncbi:MAG TPA: chromate transporter [Sphaerochaeta sp.]|nr:MAG: chromate transporter [Spirochaetes bacterium GWC2_52_13]HCG64392.1 chromate transporter [Sphaerochaeta sp.]HCJ95078.1 chromate transporter [Sphaerochaeta sp.]
MPVTTQNSLPNGTSRAKLFWTLFKTTFTLSAFTVGGGYVIVPLMRKSFVDKLSWIEENEMLDLIAIAQSAPGPIAVNTSILVGYKIAGVAGALVTLLGTILPPLIILTLLSFIYNAIKDNRIVQALFFGMSIGVAVVILDAVVTMARTVLKTRKVLPVIIMVLAFIATYALKLNIIIIILSCAAIGILAVLVATHNESKKTFRGDAG